MEWGPKIFASTMSRKRYLKIMKFIRFDEKQSRSERVLTDKFALASDIWKPFIENCHKCYNPHEHVTVDEQLFPTKSRCRFTQFMGNKPDKYGIKFFLLADSKSKYLCSGFPYLGKDEERPSNQQLGEYVVMKLMQEYLDRGHNVVCDNFFTSLSLGNQLHKRKTSLLGTIRNNRRELPAVNEMMKDMSLYETQLFSSASNSTLTVYKCKTSKVVCVLSSLHSEDISISSTRKKKPDTILVYNAHKVGVDSVNQMAKKYSTKAGSRRWPVAVFFNILDLAAINAHIVYKEVR